jgi:hypothetical protein
MVRGERSGEYTVGDIRWNFLLYLAECIDYWEKEDKVPDVRDKLERLTYSILVGIDGESSELPKFILAPNPSFGDKEKRIEEQRDYYPENYKNKVRGNISGRLAEEFRNLMKNRKF